MAYIRSGRTSICATSLGSASPRYGSVLGVSADLRVSRHSHSKRQSTWTVSTSHWDCADFQDDAICSKRSHFRKSPGTFTIVVGFFSWGAGVLGRLFSSSGARNSTKTNISILQQYQQESLLTQHSMIFNLRPIAWGPSEAVRAIFSKLLGCVGGYFTVGGSRIDQQISSNKKIGAPISTQSDRPVRWYTKRVSVSELLHAERG